MPLQAEIESESAAKAKALLADYSAEKVRIVEDADSQRQVVRGNAAAAGEGGEASGSSGEAAGGEASGGESDEAVAAWMTEAAGLMGSGGVLTAEAPGPWAGKEGTHVPTLAVAGAGDSALVGWLDVAHGMAPGDHWIDMVWATAAVPGVGGEPGLKAGEERVVAARKFSGGGEGGGSAQLTFAVPAGAETLTPYASCNLHGVWRGKAVDVRPGAGEEL